MGLDIAEMMMDLEDTFGIKFDEANDWNNPVKVIDICDYVWKRVQKSEAGKCMSSFVFYRIRKGTLLYFQDCKIRIRPSTKIKEVFPTEFSNVIWERVSFLAGFQFPMAKKSAVAISISIALASIIILLSLSLPSPGYAICTTLISFFILKIGFRLGLNYPVDDFRKLTEQAIQQNGPLIGKHFSGFSRAMVEKMTFWIISDRSGVALEKITMDSRIIQDLGMD